MRGAAALAFAAALATVRPAAAFEYRNSPVPVPAPPAEAMDACLRAAGRAHGVPPTLLHLILRVEDGRLGRVTPNASGAPPDIGPAQVNGIWVRRAAERWGTTPGRAFLALRDSFCANLEMAAFIAGLALEGGGAGDHAGFWDRFARYHSRTPHHQRRYLGLVAGQVERLLARRAAAVLPDGTRSVGEEHQAMTEVRERAAAPDGQDAALPVSKATAASMPMRMGGADPVSARSRHAAAGCALSAVACALPRPPEKSAAFRAADEPDRVAAARR